MADETLNPMIMKAVEEGVRESRRLLFVLRLTWSKFKMLEKL